MSVLRGLSGFHFHNLFRLRVRFELAGLLNLGSVLIQSLFNSIILIKVTHFVYLFKNQLSLFEGSPNLRFNYLLNLKVFNFHYLLNLTNFIIC